MSETLCPVDLTTEERDYLTALLADDLGEIPLRDELRCDLINGIMRKLAGALEVTEPWHMMGTRADGAAVGRGQGPIGGCGRTLDCTSPTLDELRYASPTATIPKGPLGPLLPEAVARPPLTTPCDPCGHSLIYHGSFGGACDHLDCFCPRFGKS